MTDEQIIEIRDSLLPSQGESFDTLAFARAVIAAQAPQAAEPVAWRKVTPSGVYLRTAETMADTSEEWDGITRAGWEPLYLAPQAPAAPISAVTKATKALAIQFEKLLCAKLGDDWRPNVSAQSLLDRLVPAHAPAAQPLTEDEIMQLFREHTWFNGSHAMTNYVPLVRAVEARIGIAPSAQGEQ